MQKNFENTVKYLSDILRGRNNNLLYKFFRTYFCEWGLEGSDLNEQGFFRVVKGMSFPDSETEKL